MTSIAFFFAAGMGLLSWLIPNHYAPWASAHSEALMAMAFVLALIGEWSRDGRARIGLTPLLCLTLLLMAVPPLQMLFGQISFAGDAWMACGYLLGAALALMLGWRLAQRLGAEAVLLRLSGLLIAASLASVGIALYQWHRLEGLGIFAADLPLGGRPFANLAQPNHLATLLFMGLVGTLYLHDRRRLNAGATFLACLFLEFGLTMTGSRTAWLSMAVLVVGLFALQRSASLRLSRPAIAAIGASFVALLMLWRPLNEALLLAGGRSFATQSEAGPRVLLWQTALDAISREPWFGYGWNQVLIAQSQLVVDHPVFGRVLMGSAHNLPLDLMLWNGVVLGGIASGFLVWWWARHAITGRDSTAVFLLASVSGVLVHALVEYPLSYAYFLFPVALMMGMLDQHAGVRTWSRVPGGWAIGGTALATVLLTATIYEYAQVEDNTRVLRFETARIGTARIQSTAPDVLLLTQWREYLRFARVEARPDMTDDELAWMRRVTERFPYAPSQYRSALAHALNDRPDIAAQEWRRLCSLHTIKKCQQHLKEWRELVRTTYPHLEDVSLPDGARLR
jgi:O-antigen ligase